MAVLLRRADDRSVYLSAAAGAGNTLAPELGGVGLRLGQAMRKRQGRDAQHAGLHGKGGVQHDTGAGLRYHAEPGGQSVQRWGENTLGLNV